MTDRLKNRLKSFVWRLGSFAVVEGLALLLVPDVALELGIPAFVVTILSLISAEITKDWNNQRTGK